MNIFIYDDQRTIRQALTAANLPISTLGEDTYTLVRPKLYMGELTHDDAIDCICESARFDMWVLDNDLGEDSLGIPLEGYRFLVSMIERYANKVPLHAYDVVSCSANPYRASAIQSYHQNWLKSLSGKR